MAEILAQQENSLRFLIADGKDEHGLDQARIFDFAADDLGIALPVAQIASHSPGWMKPTSPPSFLADVEERADALLSA